MCFCGCPFEYPRGSRHGGDCNKPSDIKGCPSDEDFEELNKGKFNEEDE